MHKPIVLPLLIAGGLLTALHGQLGQRPLVRHPCYGPPVRTDGPTPGGCPLDVVKLRRHRPW